MKFHYKNVLCLTIRYSDQLHDTEKENQWLVVVESDFPAAAKRKVWIERIETKRRRVYDAEKAKQ